MIWNYTISRPVFTIVIFLVIAIFGGYGYRQMPVREYPDIEYPIVSVNVVMPGAEPEVIETEIIEPLEEQINTIEGLKTLRSTAREQVGTVTAEFELWRDIDVAAQDVRDRVNRAQRELPETIEAPIVQKLDPDAQAIIWIALTGNERWDLVRLTEYAENTLQERLESIQGVGQIQMAGARTYAVRLRLDANKLAAHNLTAQDVVNTIQANNVDIPSGRVESEQREFLVKTQGQFSSPEPINDLIITAQNGSVVRIRDVGEAVAGVENDRQVARLSGEPAVGLGVVKQSDANMVELASTVLSRIEELSKEFPPGLEYTIASNNSVYVEASIRDLLLTIFIATGLVVVVVLAFLRTLWGTFITSLAIPASLLGGMAMTYAMGFSINTITMLGFILVIGIVVDDAIVVLENVYRKLEEGAEVVPAARVGTTEVAFAAIANSLSLAAVFIPVAFTSGLIGRFFYQFGLSVALTVFASTFTAITLTPMLCAMLLKPPKTHGRVYRWSETVFGGMESVYRWILFHAFAHRLITVLTGLVMIGLTVLFFTRLSTEFVPDIDRAEFSIAFEMPQGATLAATNAYSREIEDVLDGMDEVERYFLAIGLAEGAGPGQVHQGIVFVNLSPAQDREQNQSALMQEMRERLATIPVGQAFVLQAQVGPQQQAPLQIVLQGSDLSELAAQQQGVMAWMRQQDQYVGVNSNLKMNKPEIQITVHRDKASEMGVTVADISNTLRYLLGEPDISEIERESERYEVIPEIIQKGQMVPEDLASFYVRNQANEVVPLGNLVQIEEAIGPSEIHHFNRLRAATIAASTPPEVTLGDALQNVQRYLGENLPPGLEHTITGQAQDFEESFYYLTLALVFAVVFIYLVLSAQFESFLHPLTILGTLPLAGVGAFGALWAFDMTFNIFSFIGIIMLMGMATKNAILMIDYSNVLRERGRATVEAAKEAAQTRFRPVMMTTISTVLGMMPIALGYGAGGEARAPLGVAVASGLLATTFLTLVIIPVLYTLLDGLQTRTARLFRRKTEKQRA